MKTLVVQQSAPLSTLKLFLCTLVYIPKYSDMVQSTNAVLPAMTGTRSFILYHECAHNSYLHRMLHDCLPESLQQSCPTHSSRFGPNGFSLSLSCAWDKLHDRRSRGSKLVQIQFLPIIIIVSGRWDIALNWLFSARARARQPGDSQKHTMLDWRGETIQLGGPRFHNGVHTIRKENTRTLLKATAPSKSRRAYFNISILGIHCYDVIY